MAMGLTVKSVTRGSQAGGKLEPGDMIISCNGIAVASLSDLTSAMEMTPNGQDVSIEIERRGQRLIYSFVKARLGVAFDEIVGRQDSSRVDAATEPSIGENRTEQGASSGEASQSGEQQTAGHFTTAQTGPSGPDGRYDLARSIAKIVIVVGWLSVGFGALTFFIGLGTDEMYAGVMMIAGLVALWQGVVVVLVAYGLVGVFDIADNSARIVSSVQEIARHSAEN